MKTDKLMNNTRNKALQKGGQFRSFVLRKIQNTASFKVIKKIKTNQKFCHRKIFAKLNENINKTFLAFKSTFLALKHIF